MQFAKRAFERAITGRRGAFAHALLPIALLLFALTLYAADQRRAVAAGETILPPRAVVVPGFWDPRRRPERPDLSRIQTIRFLTDVDYPPFNYTGSDGNPAGFNVDLARLICDEIKITCTIQARPFGTLLDALNENRGDAAPRRFHRSLLPHACALCGARRQSDRRIAAGAARGNEDRGDRRHRARGLSQGDVHRSRGSALSQRRGGARRPAAQGGRSAVRRRHRAR